jgi:hypothetical protein
MIPALTRRRDPDAQQETWLIQYGDIHLGTIRLHAWAALINGHGCAASTHIPSRRARWRQRHKPR